ncbi:hypothetical protein ACFFRR_003420 [Megaselia abdita]
MDCLICHEDIIRTGYGISVECGHVFHGKCILEWMESHQTCPICRNSFTVNQIHPLFLSNNSENDENYSYEIHKREKNDQPIFIIPIEVEPSRTQRSQRITQTRNNNGACFGCVAVTLILMFIIIFFFALGLA